MMPGRKTTPCCIVLQSRAAPLAWSACSGGAAPYELAETEYGENGAESEESPAQEEEHHEAGPGKPVEVRSVAGREGEGPQENDAGEKVSPPRGTAVSERLQIGNAPTPIGERHSSD